MRWKVVGWAPWFLAAVTPPWLFESTNDDRSTPVSSSCMVSQQWVSSLCLVSTIGRVCGRHWEVG
jgi:hypothetical protein